MSTGAASIEHVHASGLRARHLGRRITVRADDGTLITGGLSDFDQRTGAGRTTIYAGGHTVDVLSNRTVTIEGLDLPGGTR